MIRPASPSDSCEDRFEQPLPCLKNLGTADDNDVDQGLRFISSRLQKFDRLGSSQSPASSSGMLDTSEMRTFEVDSEAGPSTPGGSLCSRSDSGDSRSTEPSVQFPSNGDVSISAENTAYEADDEI